MVCFPRTSTAYRFMWLRNVCCIAHSVYIAVNNNVEHFYATCSARGKVESKQKKREKWIQNKPNMNLQKLMTFNERVRQSTDTEEWNKNEYV